MSKKKKNRPLPCLGNGVSLLDSHCHLDMADYEDDLADVLARARGAGVSRIITVGIDLASSQKAIALAERHEGVFATVGVHPHHAQELAAGQAYDRLRELCRHEKVVACGEIGLDYVKEYAPIPVQKEHFVKQVALAREMNLPVIIHDREAHEDVLAILRAAAPFPAGGIMHCFSGDAAFALQVFGLGFHISIPGVVTFNKAGMLREAVRGLPLSALLLETDGPYLAPVPYRGKRNEPQYLLYTAQYVAELKGVSLEEVARQTTGNALKLFSLKDE
ncbi:TatD family hydrolase [Thiovibrio sp. JS02]